jgi:hypothetical protein
MRTSTEAVSSVTVRLTQFRQVACTASQWRIRGGSRCTHGLHMEGGRKGKVYLLYLLARAF